MAGDDVEVVDDCDAAQVEQRISHDLARPVIRHLAAPIHGNDRNVAWRQHVFQLASLTQGKYRVVLQQPQLIHRGRHAIVREGAHRMPHGQVGLTTKATNIQWQRHDRSGLGREWEMGNLLVRGQAAGGLCTCGLWKNNVPRPVFPFPVPALHNV